MDKATQRNYRDELITLNDGYCPECWEFVDIDDCACEFCEECATYGEHAGYLAHDDETNEAITVPVCAKCLITYASDYPTN